MEEMLSKLAKRSLFREVTRERFTGDVLRHRPEGVAELSGKKIGETTGVLTINLQTPFYVKIES